MKVKEMLLCALMVAVMAVLAQIAIPIGPVPFTMSIMGVYLTAGLLGGRLGAITMMVYILLGAFGAPIFTGGKGGLPVIVGPTGGFLIGYILAAYLIGWFYRGGKGLGRSYIRFTIISLGGLLIIYALGLMQLKLVLRVDFAKAAAIGLLPFLLPDIIKVFFAALVIVPVRHALAKAGLLPQGTIKSVKPEGKRMAIGKY